MGFLSKLWNFVRGKGYKETVIEEPTQKVEPTRQVVDGFEPEPKAIKVDRVVEAPEPIVKKSQPTKIVKTPQQKEFDSVEKLQTKWFSQ